MPKQRINVSLPPELVQEVDRNIENRSGLIEELLRNWTDMQKVEDEQLVKQRNKVEEELEELKQQKRELEDEISDKEDELKTIEYAINKKEEEENYLEEASQAIAPKWEELRRKTHDSEKAFNKLWVSEKFGLWEDKLDASRDELKEEVRKVVMHKYEDLI